MEPNADTRPIVEAEVTAAAKRFPCETVAPDSVDPATPRSRW